MSFNGSFCCFVSYSCQTSYWRFSWKSRETRAKNKELRNGRFPRVEPSGCLRGTERGVCRLLRLLPSSECRAAHTPRDPSEAAATLGQTGTNRGQSGGLVAQSLTPPSPTKGVGCPGKGGSTGRDPADRRPPAARGLRRHRDGWADVSTWLGAGGNEPAAPGHSVSPGLRAPLRNMGVTAPSAVGTRRLAGHEGGGASWDCCARAPHGPSVLHTDPCGPTVRKVEDQGVSRVGSR